MASSRPSASSASSNLRRNAGDQTSGGLGGRGVETNARKRSDAVDTVRYWPVVRRRIGNLK